MRVRPTGLLLFAGAVGVAALLWKVATIERPPGEGSANRTGALASDGSAPEGTSRQPPRRPFVLSKLETNKTKAFGLGKIGIRREDEVPAYAKAREMAETSWGEFIRDANPTKEQQQAILSAIYDGQLYFKEVLAVSREWSSDWAESPVQAGPPPEIEWTEDIANAVRARAHEVLDEQQVKIFDRDLASIVTLAAQVEFVQPSDTNDR